MKIEYVNAVAGVVIWKCSVEYKNASMYRGGLNTRMQRWTRECSNAELLSDLWVESCTAHKSCPAQCHCQPAGEKKVNRSTNKDHLASCLPGNTTTCHWYIGQRERSTGQKMWTIVLPTKQMNACTMLQLCLCLLVRDRQEINVHGAKEKGHQQIKFDCYEHGQF